MRLNALERKHPYSLEADKGGNRQSYSEDGPFSGGLMKNLFSLLFSLRRDENVATGTWKWIWLWKAVWVFCSCVEARPLGREGAHIPIFS